MTAAGTRVLDDGSTALTSPSPGRFRSAVAIGDLVHPGSRLGELDRLGRLSAVTVPAGASGVITALADPALASAPVEFGGMLVTIDPRAHAATGATAASATAAHAATGLVFRAPTSGRFYGRSSPDKPAFVTVGAELTPGTTICLLEVMKTFHRVTYGGAELPSCARVRELLVAEGADVSAGDPLIALDPVA